MPGGDARVVLPALLRALRWTSGTASLDARLAALLTEVLPALGDWCAVDVLTADGALRRVAVLHVDDGRRAAALDLQHRFPPHPGDRSGPARVVRTGLPEIVLDQPETAWLATTRDAEQLALLRVLGVNPYVVLPLLTDGAALGALTVVAHAGGGFDAPRYALAEMVAACVALLVEQAALREQAGRGGAPDAGVAADEERLAAERRQREQAERASHAKSAYLAAMSHEIRTPLTSILGYAELLRLELGPTLAEPQHGRLLRLEASCRHLLQVVGGLLDFARIEAGEAELDLGVNLVAPVVETALDIVRPQADARGVVLVDEVSPAEGRCFVGDVARVRQILVNLLVNAVKFSEAGGAVIVRCDDALSTEADTATGAALPVGRRWTRIHVCDGGMGIAPDQLPRIFDPFVRASAPATDGIGLGLAISRELARRMDGEITVRSAPGTGAEFVVWLLPP